MKLKKNLNENNTNSENLSNKENIKNRKTKKTIKIQNKNENENKSDNNISNNNYTKTNSKNIIIRPFNRELSKEIKNINILKDNKDYKKEMNEYQNSFDDIIQFSKKLTALKKKAINCIIFHTNNSDGIMSANIAVKYLVENKKKDISLIPAKPSSGNGKINERLTKYNDEMKNKNILILDLQYNQENLNHIKSLAKNVYIIDDHSIANKNDDYHFVGSSNHAAVAYTWKFFYPKKDVPIYYQLIDNDDRKLQLSYSSKYRSMTSFFNYRLFHSPYLKINFDTVEDFEKLDYAINGEFDNISTLIGHYYDELANNIKEQVARNARKQTFQGHPVYVLNYNDPVLYKMVARQMLSNAKKRGENIHFAVLWGYEYTSQAYKVYLCEFHSGKPKYNLPKIAKILGNIGKHFKGGGGDRYVGNFYWPHSKDKDIWDLFSKNYLKDKIN